MALRVLFIGDIVGPGGVDYVVGRLAELRAAHRVDCVIVNAENAEHSDASRGGGFGMAQATIDRLFAAGVDVITSGNHAWDHPEHARVLAHPRVLRPYNLPADTIGHGLVTVEAAGQPVTVINVCDVPAIATATPLWDAWLATAADRRGAVIVDFHGQSSLTKQSFAYAVDGEAAAVLGTHTHEPTLPLHRLPGGCALVSDVGMSGAFGGVAGFAPATGPMVLGAVLLQIEGNRTVGIARVS